MMSDAHALAMKAKKEGFLLCKTKDKRSTGCFLGGLPQLPDRFEWPYTKISYLPSIPLHFVSQINLAAVPTKNNQPEFPTHGTLLFFLDPIFGPSFEYSNGTAVVLYCPEDVSSLPERPMPKVSFENLPVNEMSLAYRESPMAFEFEKWNVRFEPRVSFDSHFFHGSEVIDVQAEDLILNLGVNEIDRLQTVLEKSVANTDGHAQHSMFAGPDSPGKNISGKVTFDTEAVPLLALRSDYSLGLQIPGEWVVFWISPQDLARGEFSLAYASEGRG